MYVMSFSVSNCERLNVTTLHTINILEMRTIKSMRACCCVHLWKPPFSTLFPSRPYCLSTTLSAQETTFLYPTRQNEVISNDSLKLIKISLLQVHPITIRTYWVNRFSTIELLTFLLWANVCARMPNLCLVGNLFKLLSFSSPFSFSLRPFW